jgi:signal transduction histidine kinase
VQDLSLHILDIVQNSIRADARRVEIRLTEDQENDLLTVEIIDDGKGMDPRTLRRAVDPFFTGKPGRRFGLGLAMFRQATREAEGSFEISSTPAAGTSLTATFRLSHPDCKPVGDMAATLEALVAAHPGVEFGYDYTAGDQVIHFDTREVERP